MIPYSPIEANILEIHDEQAGGITHSPSMVSINSLIQKVSKFNVHQSLCLIQIN